MLHFSGASQCSLDPNPELPNGRRSNGSQKVTVASIGNCWTLLGGRGAFSPFPRKSLVALSGAPQLTTSYFAYGDLSSPVLGCPSPCWGQDLVVEAAARSHPFVAGSSLLPARFLPLPTAPNGLTDGWHCCSARWLPAHIGAWH